jgi:hypothetical protein
MNISNQCIHNKINTIIYKVIYNIMEYKQSILVSYKQLQYFNKYTITLVNIYNIGYNLYINTLLTNIWCNNYLINNFKTLVP